MKRILAAFTLLLALGLVGPSCWLAAPEGSDEWHGCTTDCLE